MPCFFIKLEYFCSSFSYYKICTHNIGIHPHVVAPKSSIVHVFLSVPATLGVADNLGVAADYIAIAIILNLGIMAGNGNNGGDKEEGKHQVGRHDDLTLLCFSLGQWQRTSDTLQKKHSWFYEIRMRLESYF